MWKVVLGLLSANGQSSTAGPLTLATYSRTLDRAGHLRKGCHGYCRIGAVQQPSPVDDSGWNVVCGFEPRDHHAANTRRSHVPRGWSWLPHSPHSHADLL